MSHPQFVVLCIPRDGAWGRCAVLIVSLSQRSDDLCVVSTVTSSILCLVHVLSTQGRWIVPPLTCILTISPESLLPTRSTLVKIKAETLYLEWVMVVNTFQHFLDLIILFSLFPALHHRVSSQLYASSKSEIVPERGQLSLFTPLSNHNHCLAAPSVWLSDKKRCWTSRSPWWNAELPHPGKQRDNLKTRLTI